MRIARRPGRLLLFVAVVTVPVTIAAACGGGSDGAPSPDAATDSAAEARRDTSVSIEPDDSGARDAQTRDAAPPPPHCPAPIVCADAGDGGATELARTSGVSIQGIAADGCNVFWGEHDGTGTVAAIKSVPRCGGPVTTIASGQPYPATSVTTDAWFVYWTGREVIRRAPKGGGFIQTLAYVPGQDPWALAVDDTFVYWTDNHAQASRVYRVPLAGGAPSEVAIIGSGSPYGMALSGDRIYFANLQIRSALKDGGDVVDLGGSGLGSLWCIGVDDTDVYYTNYGDNVVMRVPKSGGDASLFAPASGPRCLTVGGGYVYWANDASGIMRAPTDGGDPVEITGGPYGSYGFAFVTLDDTYAFYGFAGSVRRVLK